MADFLGTEWVLVAQKSWVARKYAGHLLGSQLHRNRKKCIKDCLWQMNQAALFIHMSGVAFGVHTGKTESISFSVFLIRGLRVAWTLHSSSCQIIGENYQSFPSPSNFKTWLALRIIYFLWIKTEITNACHQSCCSSCGRLPSGLARTPKLSRFCVVNELPWVGKVEPS